jgi:DNA-binding MurR/RpiR family transcriptional regulator
MDDLAISSSVSPTSIVRFCEEVLKFPFATMTQLLSSSPQPLHRAQQILRVMAARL